MKVSTAVITASFAVIAQTPDPTCAMMFAPTDAVVGVTVTGHGLVQPIGMVVEAGDAVVLT